MLNLNDFNVDLTKLVENLNLIEQDFLVTEK